MRDGRRAQAGFRSSGVFGGRQPGHQRAPAFRLAGVPRADQVHLLHDVLRAQAVARGEGAHSAVGQVEVVVRAGRSSSRTVAGAPEGSGVSAGR